MNRKNLDVIISAEEISHKVTGLADEISRDYKEKNLLLVCVLKGAIIFTGDLMRRLKVPLEIDFMAVSSYGADTASSGVVRIMKDLDRSIKGKDVLIVEDVIDTGLTLSYLHANLLSRNPASLKVVTLLDKPDRRRVVFEADYCGFKIPDKFVVGYGLDYGEHYRQLADICIFRNDAG